MFEPECLCRIPRMTDEPERLGLDQVYVDIERLLSSRGDKEGDSKRVKALLRSALQQENTVRWMYTRESSQPGSENWPVRLH